MNYALLILKLGLHSRFALQFIESLYYYVFGGHSLGKPYCPAFQHFPPTIVLHIQQGHDLWTLIRRIDVHGLLQVYLVA